ncbi:glutamine amidotransferase [Pararobbsia silviterrae]|uniref:Glutamine amidotransferase n=1 Tax=Pararobbsia silviterrae TaxID=1792498 RepID=A0A494X6Z7_9BURK|nr:glutamine amidotransferase [Pararobbsia silviterrae]RKP46210.1 glutamine amidotransferase [Pararobbsia silviterrae]
MRRALAITHVAFEDLGSLEPALLEAGFDIESIDACTADLRAIDPEEADLLVVLGGPIGVYERETYPFIGPEIELIRERLAARLPTLGICLGAQLLAAALDAKVYPGTAGKEIGWAPVQAVPGVVAPPWFDSVLEPGLRVLHWHGDTFDLPDGATLLASTAQYRNQAFAVGDYALGLQFHPEVTAQRLERWLVGHASELAQARTDIHALRSQSHAFAPVLETAAQLLWQQWLTAAFDGEVQSTR